MRHFADMGEVTIPSLGFVSINIDQRDLIDEELRRVWAGDELVDRYRERCSKEANLYSSKILKMCKATSVISSLSR